MSLVGPRPCLTYEFDNYLPWQKERFDTLPGLTGYWQICGKNRTTFVEMIRYDIDYARRRSLWLDWIIILKTVPALLVQMRDTPIRSKRHINSAVSEPEVAARAANHSPMRGAALGARVMTDVNPAG